MIRANLAVYYERKKELDRVKSEVEGLNRSKVSAEKELMEINAEMQILGQKRHDGQAIKELLQTLSVKLAQKKEEAQRAYDDIDQEYNESLAQLKILLQKVDFNPDDVHSRIEALNTQKLQLIRKKEKLENEKDEINTNLGKLNHELLQEKKILMFIFKNMVSVSRRYTLPGNTIDKSAIHRIHQKSCFEL